MWPDCNISDWSKVPIIFSIWLETSQVYKTICASTYMQAEIKRGVFWASWLEIASITIGINKSPSTKNPSASVIF